MGSFGTLHKLKSVPEKFEFYQEKAGKSKRDYGATSPVHYKKTAFSIMEKAVFLFLT